MRASTLSLLAFGTLALAQDLSGLPTCAEQAALGGVGSSGCSLTDASCICNNAGFISSLQSALSTSCTSTTDQQAACTWGNSFCSKYGVTIPCTTSDSTGGSSSDAGSQQSSTTSDAGNTAAATDGSMSTTSSVSTPTDGSMNSMTSSSTGSVSTVPSASMSSILNGTLATTAGNMTHAPTSMAPTTTAGATSPYTGTGNSAARQTGIFGAVFGVALLFAFF